VQTCALPISVVPANHLVAHGFGAVTVGHAGVDARLAGQIDTVTLLGPVATGPIRAAADFGLGPGNVFVAAARGDRIAHPGAPGRFLRRGLGGDPLSEAFGARELLARYPDTREFA